MKKLTDFLNESRGQRLSLRDTNKPYNPETDILIQLKDTREARSKELKFQHAKENQKIAFNRFIEMVKDVQKNTSEIRNYFDNVYLNDGGASQLDLLTCDVDKFSCNYDATLDFGSYTSYIMYDGKPFKYCGIRSDIKDVSHTWLCACALRFEWNDTLNKKMADMIAKQVSKSKYSSWLIAYNDEFELRAYTPEKLKTFLKATKDIIDRW